MTQKDYLGNVISGASANAVTAYQQALHAFQCYIDDPVAILDKALVESPTFVMGRVLHAYLHLFGTEPVALPAARSDLEIARRLPVSSRERGHLSAISHLMDSEWHAAGRVLEDIAIEHPRDVLALQAGHLVDFFTGSSRMLRDRITRALPVWSSDMPGYHALLGMQAFGLEETGLYERAEVVGRRAVELEPRDAWAQHAVAHVMEMQGRQQDGIAWMRANPHAWAQDNFFAVHNWWHLALYHLDLDQLGDVLELYDGPIYGQQSKVVLDMVDASALLWRLYLRGVDVGDRWQAIADAWEPVVAASQYAFNDVHAMMAFVGANRPQSARAVLEAQARALQGHGDNVMFTREVGAPLTHAIRAFGEGHFAESVRVLRSVRNQAYRFGGSHAQRDLIDLTLIEAALRDKQYPLARALAAERADLKPTSPAARTLLQRAGETARSKAA